MGLTTFKKKDALPNIDIDTTPFVDEGDGGVWTFRQPRSPDLLVSARRRASLKAAHPAWSDEMRSQVLLLSSCYVRKEGEAAGVNLDNAMADVADSNMGLFFHIMKEFGTAYTLDLSAKEAGED
ncbi:MAG: hypothetical protein V4671_31945 [Armatimonadota bacterium]